MMSDYALSPERSLLVLIDWQERLEAAMDEGRRDAARRNAAILLQTANLTGVPVLVTEQYPKGLGPTVESLGALHQTMHPYYPTIAKTCFAAMDSDYFRSQLEALRRRAVVLMGMETHICVWQTARALREQGYAVHVAADAVLSRTEENRQIGLGLMRGVGCVITSAEAVAFDLVRDADHPAFRSVSKLVR